MISRVANPFGLSYRERSSVTVCKPVGDRDGRLIIACRGLVPREGRTTRKLSQYIVARIIGISDLELRDLVELL